MYTFYYKTFCLKHTNLNWYCLIELKKVCYGSLYDRCFYLNQPMVNKTFLMKIELSFRNTA